MPEIMPGLPDNLLGIKAVGEVDDDDDDEDVLEPAADHYLSRNDKIRCLYHLGPEFTGYESDAMWEDTKLGLRTFTKLRAAGGSDRHQMGEAMREGVRLDDARSRPRLRCC